MYTDNDNINTRQYFNVKKPSRRMPGYNFYSSYPTNYSLLDWFVNGILQTSRFFLGVTEASLEAARTFNSQLLYSTFRSQGYSDEYIQDIFEANAEYHDKMAQLGELHRLNTSTRFHQEMAEKYRAAKNNMNNEAQEPVEAATIDYDLLAKKIAEEMKKNM